MENASVGEMGNTRKIQVLGEMGNTEENTSIHNYAVFEIDIGILDGITVLLSVVLE